MKINENFKERVRRNVLYKYPFLVFIDSKAIFGFKTNLMDKYYICYFNNRINQFSWRKDLNGFESKKEYLDNYSEDNGIRLALKCIEETLLNNDLNMVMKKNKIKDKWTSDDSEKLYSMIDNNKSMREIFTEFKDNNSSMIKALIQLANCSDIINKSVNEYVHRVILNKINNSKKKQFEFNGINDRELCIRKENERYNKMIEKIRLSGLENNLPDEDTDDDTFDIAFVDFDGDEN